MSSSSSAAAASVAAVVATSPPEKGAGRVLLPSHVVPIRYDLALEPHLDTYTFTGQVRILMKIQSPPKAANDQSPERPCSITLHAKELGFFSAEYQMVDEDSTTTTTTTRPAVIHTAQEIRVHLPATTVEFIFADPLPEQGTLRLNVAYSGFLNNQMAGFYRSSYTNAVGQTCLMASTQFEALDARRALPCIDEPSIKAIFAVQITAAPHFQVVSNMPVAQITTSTTPSKNGTSSSYKKVWTFMDTPVMSTYLLAFAVGEFDALSARTQHGVLVTVYTPPGRAASGQFALDTAVQALDQYDDFFGLPYPLPKLDMMAISEFAAGAMENWGLVTYREVDLLIDPITASALQKQRVATVVTHELAHQWFGNLVTMAWWDDLWLNEGFASWAENWASDVLYPTYAMWDQFTVEHFSHALRLDALTSSHPIQVPIHHAEEVDQVFDAVSYCKGGCVVRMIRAVLGAAHFQQGLAQYMQKHAYGNTETYHLWQAWEQVSKIPVQDLCASWTEQMGFPLLKVVAEDWTTVPGQVTLQLAQQWFLADGQALDEAGLAKKWTIPILVATATEGTLPDMTLMREMSTTMTIPLTTNQEASDAVWIKLNAGQEVPMRVLPGPEMLQRLARGVQNKTLPTIDRAGLIQDAYALVKAGHLSPVALMQLLGHYRDEDEYIVWEGLSETLLGLETVLSEDEGLSKHFHALAKSMVVRLCNKVGWDRSEKDGHLTTLLRATMISLLSVFAYDDETVQAEATRRFQAFLQDANDVTNLPTDMRPQVFKIVLKNGGVQEYEQIKAYFSTAKDNVERKHVLTSLGDTPNAQLQRATLEWAVSGAIKLQDFFYPMGSVGRSSRQGRQISWTFFQENVDKIQGMVAAASSSLMDACIVGCCGGFCSEERAQELEAFFQNHPLPRNSRKIAQMLETTRTNAKFLRLLQQAPDLSQDEFWQKLMQ